MRTFIWTQLEWPTYLVVEEEGCIVAAGMALSMFEGGTQIWHTLPLCLETVTLAKEVRKVL